MPPSEPIDWTEGLMPVPAIAAILLGISMSKTHGWMEPSVLGLIAAGMAIMVLWARRSLAAREPFVDLRLLGTRNVALANLAMVFFALGSMQSVFVFSTYTQNPAWTTAGLGLGATIAGLAKLPSDFLPFFAGPLSGWLQQKAGLRVPFVAGGVLMLIGWTLALGLPNSLIEVILLLCVISFGTTIVNAAVPNVIVASVPKERTSEAIGTMAVVRGMFSGIGAQIIAVLLATETLTAPGGAQLPSQAGFRIVMGWVVGVTAVVALSGLLLRTQHGQGEPGR